MRPQEHAELRDLENWWGGFYELALELGPENDARLDKAIAALCSATGAEAWYPMDAAGGVSDEVVACSLESLLANSQIRAVAHTSQIGSIVCGLLAIRGLVGASSVRRDWLCFYVPMGALGRRFSEVGAYPFADVEKSLTWRQPLDSHLAEIARRVYKLVPFSLGLIGIEVSGEVESEDLKQGIPEDRPFGYLVPNGEALRYYPATV